MLLLIMNMSWIMSSYYSKDFKNGNKLYFDNSRVKVGKCKVHHLIIVEKLILYDSLVVR